MKRYKDPKEDVPIPDVLVYDTNKIKWKDRDNWVIENRKDDLTYPNPNIAPIDLQETVNQIQKLRQIRKKNKYNYD